MCVISFPFRLQILFFRFFFFFFSYLTPLIRGFSCRGKEKKIVLLKNVLLTHTTGRVCWSCCAIFCLFFFCLFRVGPKYAVSRYDFVTPFATTAGLAATGWVWNVCGPTVFLLSVYHPLHQTGKGGGGDVWWILCVCVLALPFIARFPQRYQRYRTLFEKGESARLAWLYLSRANNTTATPELTQMERVTSRASYDHMPS